MPGLADVPILANRATLQTLVTRAIEEKWTVQKLSDESGVAYHTASAAMSERVTSITENEERKSLKIGSRVWNAIGDVASRRVKFIERLNKVKPEDMTIDDIKLENAAVNGLKGFLDMLEKFGSKVTKDDDPERLVGGSLNRKS